MGLTFFLVIGTLLMLGVMLYIRKFYQVNYWKTVVVTILLTASGVLGTKLMFWIETGNTGGVSFFGAIFFTPFLMMLMALALRIPIGTILDMCAPSECIMLALMKLRCMYDGCCIGRMIAISDDIVVRFPSQIVEMMTILGLMSLLLAFIRNRRYRGKIYACYMIGYGATRFGLNLLRETNPFIWILPVGNFWSLISIGVGSFYLLVWEKTKSINIHNN